MAREIKPGVIYTVSRDYLFLPCWRGYVRVVSPGHKFLVTYECPKDYLSHGAAFRLVDSPASHFFVLENKYLDRLVEWKKEE